MKRPSVRALGLRQRVVLSYLAGGVLLSVVSAVLTWTLAAGYLQTQRTRIATAEAVNGALVVQQGLSRAGRIPELLERVTAPNVEAALHYRGEWYSSSLAISRDDLPAGLVEGLQPDRPLRQRVTVDGEPRLVVGLPLPGVDADYFAVLSLN